MHVRRPWSITLVAASALLLGSLSTAAPAAAADGLTYLQIDGEAGDPATGGRDGSYAAPSDSFQWLTATPSAIDAYVVAATNDSAWFVELVAPAGEEFTAGTTYTDLGVPGLQKAGQAGLSVNDGCAKVRGSLTIHEIEKDPVSGALTRLAASFVQICNQETVGSRGSIGYNATKLTPLLPSTTSRTAGANGPVTVSGRLEDLHGPLVGAVVEVSRPDGTGGTKTLSDTTDATGAFSVADTIGTTARTWAVTYAGDPTRFSAPSTITVTPVKLKSTLSLTVPTTTVTRGTAYVLKGLLKGSDAAIPGVTVTLKRTDLAGTRTVYVKTTSSGAFLYRDVPAVGGKVTWTATWPGNGRYAKPAAATKSLTVSRLATSLTITTDKTVYSYQGTAVVTVHLGRTWNGRTVSVYALNAEMTTRKLLKAGTVSSSGNLVVQVPIRRRTVLTAVFAGDYRFAPDTAQRVVTARSKVVFSFEGAYGRSGSTYLFRIGENVSAQALVLPYRGNECQKLVVQRLRGSTWETTYTNSCAWTASDSILYFPIYVDSTWRRARVQVVVPTIREAVGVTSPWTYLAFT